MDSQRTILLLVLVFSLVMLWDGWQKRGRPQEQTVAARSAAGDSVPAPSAPGIGAVAGGVGPVPGEKVGMAQAPRVRVRTDVLLAEVSAEGGNLVRVELLKHRATGDGDRNLVLLDEGMHRYTAQSGLIGAGLPTHKTMFRVPSESVELKPGEEKVAVRLEADVEGLRVVKTLSFARGSYLVDVNYEVTNRRDVPVAGHGYFQLTRDGKAPEGLGWAVQTFTGPAFYTQDAKFQKVEFSEVEKGSAKFAREASDGWVAMVQHYFFSAWLPRNGVAREFYARKVGEDLYSAGVILPLGTVEPGQAGSVGAPLYVGPQEQDKLEALAPGLELVVDYGWLTVIAAPLFWVLQWIHKLVGNWGWAIIGLTVLIKLIFFPLSAASYKSMAKMRVVTPKLAKIKEMYGNDKTRLNQEMMELYKKERINPLGGCLPILVQIPVFIALYWVLLGSVEMRQAPWVGWIQDLSAKDPYFVLPLVMGVTMLVQTKLNPTPPDPIQAKVMLLMPIVFTGMFLFFPAGLVLYWTVNNLLSIAQQWQITRLIEGGNVKAKAG
ncbi:MAG: membrane protein insertase YidC [Betaproteobacteria bacterium]|nr:membrane protein insertase YidC [Betaproteobacteria bacterium]